MIRNTHLTGSPAAVANYMKNEHEQHITRSGEEKATGYYSQEGGAPSEWFGEGAEMQGLSGRVDSADAEAALSGVVKHTGEDLSTRGGQTAETRRMGEELTIAAPKSVSLMAIEDPRVMEAHRAAVRTTMHYVEDEMVHARLGKGGKKGNDFTGNITAALYDHEDARDTSTGRVAPHIHTHAIVANMTQRGDGKWVNLKLDWGHNNEKKMAADAVYKAELARQVKALGYEIERGQGASFEIVGISREQIEHFSPRSQDIKEEIGGVRDKSTAKERQAAQNKTKGKKSTLSREDQRFEWRKEFREQGLDLPALKAAALERAADGIPRQEVMGQEAVKSAVRHLSERQTVFSEQSLKAEALAAGLGDVSPQDIDAAIKSRAGGLVYAGQAEGLKDRQFTTKDALYREAEILQRARDGRGQAARIVPETHEVHPGVSAVHPEEKEQSNVRYIQHKPQELHANQVKNLSENSLRKLSGSHMDADQQRQNTNILHDHARPGGSGDQDLRWESAGAGGIAQVIAERETRQGFPFSQGQRNAVDLALTTEDRHIGIVGAAGAGKTTAMAAIVEQYQKAGYEVIGVAPSAAAAHELESAGCNDTRTLASELQEKPSGAGSKKLYVMDEAGMVSAKDMDVFMRKADSENARSILVGDPLQLAAVEAGSPFAQMLKTDAIVHADIDEIQRQNDPQLREIAQAFAKGNASGGVNLARPYMTTVEVENGGDRSQALADAAAAAYLQLPQEERGNTLLLAGTNKTRQATNTAIREGLQAERTLGNRAVTVTALDKLDLTKEAATRAGHYVSKDEKTVVVNFDRDLRDRRTGATLAEKGSQWTVTATDKGMLKLQSRKDPENNLVINPAKASVSAYTAREMELRAGDRVMFRQNDKERDINNGTAGIVQSVDAKGKATIKTSTGQSIEIDARRAEVMDYAYARTVHSSQGATVDRAIVVGEASRVATAESAYVACSREKTGLQIITDNPDKLSENWSRFADRQTAMETVRTQVPDNLIDIKQAREDAAAELGRSGDLSRRSERQDNISESKTTKDQIVAQQPEPARTAVQEVEHEM